MKNNQKQGVIYYRVSTEDQAQNGVSLEQQKKACIEYAQRNNIKIVEIFHDDGLSAKSTDRLELQNMLRACSKKSNAIDCVIVYKIDRLSRNLNDYTNILVLLNKMKIKLLSTTEAIDDTPTGKYIGNIMAASAQFDNDLKSQRITACMTEKMKQGVWCWKAPFGYLNSQDKSKKKIIIVDKKRRHLIKLIFEKYSTGLYSLEEVRKIVNKKGLTTWKGKEISLQFIYKIIIEKFYIGIMTSKDIEYKGTHETFIEEEMFYKCQQILNENNNKANIPRIKINKNFPLRNFAICSFCGRPLTASFSRGRWGGKYPYYRCYNSKCLSKKSIAKKKIEDEFYDYLEEITPNKKFLNVFKTILIDVWQKRYKEINQNREIMIKKLEILKQEKKNIINMKKKELLSDEDFKEEIEEVKQKIINQEIILNETEIKKFDINKVITDVFDFIASTPEFWQKAKYEQKIIIQGLIFPEKTIYNYSGFETPIISLLFQQKKELATANSSMVPPRGVEPLLLG